MQTKLLMGNEAMALAAVRAGVGVVTGYPGTPSTEVLQSIAKLAPPDVYVEWSVNEKVALEVAAGAAYAGKRALVTMKQVGLNVACDPVMSLSYVGVKGALVVLVADDPGPISSQTEQDTRTFAAFSKLPVFDPSSPEEAYAMLGDAFTLSEELGCPVLFRPTTRVCHACAPIRLDDSRKEVPFEGFVRDPKWIIFPRLSYNAHKEIEQRNTQLRTQLSTYPFNTLEGAPGAKLGIATGGVSYAYTKEALTLLDDVRRDAGVRYKLLKVATPFPFPEALAVDFLDGLDQVLVLEELDPVIERELTYICGKHKLPTRILGKLTGDAPCAGENTVEDIVARLADSWQVAAPALQTPRTPPPPLPIRPPVLCAGCPHRASFFAVKQAARGKKAIFTGDIGCYTLGNAQPLDMVDTCLCMGADLTIAQGLAHAQPDTVCFAFIGDSTFFHSGMTGIANAVTNGANLVAVILDNGTTAMTGGQPNPGMGKNARGETVPTIDIPGVLTALGVWDVQVVDPLDQPAAIAAAQRAADLSGVRAIVYRSPCIAIAPPAPALTVDADKCTGCKKCVRALGCPALVKAEHKIAIDAGLCTGCGICAGLCPVAAIGGSHNG